MTQESTREIRTAEPCEIETQERIHVKGKFLMWGNEKFYLKGVTYGTFCPDADGNQYPPAEVVDIDFAAMADNGINSVRTYTPPPVYLLDKALEYGLKVMVGLPWEQHLTFLDKPEQARRIVADMRAQVRALQQHPAILCYAIGNEIPATIVRWYGETKITQFLHRLYNAVKAEDPAGLVTYVNFPTTEYLTLPFLDFFCFNVYLETPEKMNGYIAKLHNLIGDKPLLLAEVGLDSQRNGVEKQAESLAWQLKLIFAKGCVGTFVFAWTDEWWRGGFDIEDWDFGLVDRNRQPKPALHAVSQVYADAPFPNDDLPFISVAVCSYNGSATIRDTLEGLMALDYPNFEVIVVNDGSTDNLLDIVSEYDVQLISTENQGLSNARNTALYAAQGEIVAYIDDDAYPDPQWLRYLAYAFLSSDHAGIGGPNLPPADDGLIAHCVANAPGGPVHVLTTDELAEHIPGCNMAFRREVLLEVGGFDPIYRAAGDDVDLCWRVLHTGRTIGFHAAAFVWHHRRNSVKMYWRQQKGYGKAEALLEGKWPQKYNSFGHLSWTGRIYGNGLTLPIQMGKRKIFHGTWGSALFQSVYEQAPNSVAYLPLMPEWFLLMGLLAVLSVLSVLWQPLLWALPLLVVTCLVVLTQAALSAARADMRHVHGRFTKARLFALTTLLHLMQPVARLYGRIQHGLTPWRKRSSGEQSFSGLLQLTKCQESWSEEWHPAEELLARVEHDLLSRKVRARRGGTFDRWDLQASCSFFSGARAIMAIEEHGGGRMMIKFKSWSVLSQSAYVIIGLLLGLSVLAVAGQAYVLMDVLLMLTVLFVGHCLLDMSRSMSDLAQAFNSLSAPQAAPARNVVLHAPVLSEQLDYGNYKLA
ncbi:glycosyltransferase [Hymenobacter busanensis]|uniref:Glycosyltransferase n=1 Tax=Hymenobacter busanensis TaxID=2607656 RepID=A0A7L4ZWG4_9BACT|nr:glycosyltransferase [Hymenobacter busanensis]KAA9332320.1 glycosyltransferase [Hymenobacter busanensis]QHJ07343.1 glycosyltransferase [Hymenobacter busanensis]